MDRSRSFKPFTVRRSNKRPYPRKNERLATVALVKQIVNSKLDNETELKYVNTVLTPTSIDYSGVVNQLTVVSQGTTDTTRIGDTIKLEKLEIGFQSILVDTTNLMRFIIFKWIPNNTPSVTTILSNATLGTANAPLSNLVVDQEPLYQILYDRLMCLNAGVPSIAQKVMIPLKGQCQYVGGSSTIGTNQIWALYVSDSGVAPNPTFAFTCNVFFTDA